MVKQIYKYGGEGGGGGSPRDQWKCECQFCDLEVVSRRCQLCTGKIPRPPKNERRDDASERTNERTDRRANQSSEVCETMALGKDRTHNLAMIFLPQRSRLIDLVPTSQIQPLVD